MVARGRPRRKPGMNARGDRSPEQAQELKRRVSSLEAHAAGLSLAQVMTRSFRARSTTGRAAWSDFTGSPRPMRSAASRMSCCAPNSRSHSGLSTASCWSPRSGPASCGTGGATASEIVVVSHQSLHRGSAGAPPLVTEVNNDITEERRGHEARQYLATIVEYPRTRSSARRWTELLRRGTTRPRRCSATAPRR